MQTFNIHVASKPRTRDISVSKYITDEGDIKSDLTPRKMSLGDVGSRATLESGNSLNKRRVDERVGIINDLQNQSGVEIWQHVDVVNKGFQTVCERLGSQRDNVVRILQNELVAI